MNTDPLIDRSWHLESRVKAARAASPNKASNLAALGRFDEAMAHFKYPASIWDRKTWNDDKGPRSTFLRRGDDVARRSNVWAMMAEPKNGVKLSTPQIAKATGASSHSTVVTALGKRRAGK